MQKSIDQSIYNQQRHTPQYLHFHAYIFTKIIIGSEIVEQLFNAQ